MFNGKIVYSTNLNNAPGAHFLLTVMYIVPDNTKLVT